MVECNVLVLCQCCLGAREAGCFREVSVLHELTHTYLEQFCPIRPNGQFGVVDHNWF